MGVAQIVHSAASRHGRRLLWNAGLTAFISILATVGSQPATTNADAVRQKLTISPTANDISVDPGGHYSGTMTVVNQGPTPMNLQLYASPYFVSGEQYRPVFENVNQSVRADSWVHVSPTTVTAVPQGVIEANYNVAVPANTHPGSYYAVLFAQAAGGSGASLGFSERAGEILYITVNGPATHAGSVDFTPIPYVAFSQTVHPDVKVHNTGSVHFIAHATWAVTPILGDDVGNIEQTGHVLPGTVRLMTAPLTLSSSYGLGIYQLTRTVSYDGNAVHRTQLIVVVSPLIPVLVLVGVVMFILIRYSHGHRIRGKHV